MSKKRNLSSLLKDLKEASERTKEVELLATYILKVEEKNSAENTLSTNEIFEKYQELKSEYTEIPEIPEATFTVYINRLSNSSESSINCPGRKQGYYLDEIFEKIEPSGEEDEEEIQKEKEEAQKAQKKGYILEKDLYPIFEKWLFELDNEVVKDISSKNGHGKWGNPDLVGFKINHLFNLTDIEITTIEAKLTYDHWQKWFFEAVAHTVFSNRSYFAFLHSEDHINKIDAELKHYAEIFSVGILVIAIDAKDYLKVKNKEKYKLEEGNYKLVEYYPAPYNTPHVKFQKRFFGSLEIKEVKDFYTFGKTLDN